MEGGEQWSDDSDEELLNEEPPTGIDPTFANNVLAIKNTLYDTIVTSPDIEDDESQNNERLNDYLKYINKVYVLATISQNGKKNTRNMDEFPEETKEYIQRTLEWIEKFFSMNQLPAKIPYTEYIRNHFFVFPYVQNNSFIQEE
jgi:hypothetical protein